MQTLILVLAFSQILFADPYRKAVEAVNKGNRAVQKAGQPPCETCEVALAGLEDPPWSQCLQELCPNGFGLLQSELDKADKLTITDPKDGEILDLAMVSFRKELQGGLLAYENANEVLAAGKPIASIPARVLAHSYERADRMGLIETNEDGSVNIGATKQKIYDEALSAGKPQMSKGELQTMIAVYNTYRTAIARIKFLEEHYDFHVQRYSSSEIQTQVNETLDLLSADTERLSKYFKVEPRLMFDSLDPSLVERLRSGMYTREDLEELRDDAVNASILSGIASNPVLAGRLMGRNVVPSEYLNDGAESLLPGFITSLKAYLEESKKGTTVDGFEQDVRDACTNTLNLAKQTLPNEDQIKAFPANLERYKSEFKSAMAKRMSAHSLGILNSAIGNWKFSIPPTYEDFRAGLKRKIEAQIRENDMNLELIKKLKESEPGISAVFNLSAANQSSKDLDWGDEIKEVCLDAQIKPLRDAAYASADNLRVGSFSVSRGWIGDTVTKHELGHKTEKLFTNGKMSTHSNSWFDSVKTCLQKPVGNDTYLNEDWADLASAMAGGTEISCSFMTDLESSLTLKVPDASYTHSADLYRALHQHMYKNGNIPQVCTDALAAKGETFSLTNCDLPGATAAGK